jgi:general secretion pathway protein D
LDEAFNLLSTAMATNQFAISEQGDTLVVMSTRNALRSYLPVVTELPPLKPERLITMVFTFKNVSADEVNRRLRVLPSKDGEMTPFGKKMIVTDWTTNIHRIARVLSEVDQPGLIFSSPGEAPPPFPSAPASSTPPSAPSPSAR